MRNVIKYYYKIETAELSFFNNYYLFDNYMLKELVDDINFNIYNILIYNNIPVHKIIFNIFNSYYTIIDNKKYVLYELCDKCIVNLDLIAKFNYKTSFIDITKIKKNDCSILWTKKIDFYENNIESSDLSIYYIGLSELAIRTNYENKHKITYGISHRRITNYYDYFCPDNFTIDCITRDYAEYFKMLFFYKDENIDLNYIDKIFQNNYLIGDFIMFFSRMCFPSYFFDYIEKKHSFKNFYSKINMYENLLYKINLYLINKYNYDEITWLKKI